MRALVLAVMLMAGPAFADEVPVPTEGGEHAAAPADPEPTGCHRCVGNPDGGFSDSNYSNPDGAWHTADGNTTYDPGHSQDWYEGTGPYSGSGDCQGTYEPGTAAAIAYDNANSGGNERAKQTGTARANGGGHDR